MKILHVTNHFHPCVGGIEKNVLDLCEQLIKRGHKSDVLCLNKCSDGKTLPPRGKYKKTLIYRTPFIDMKYYKIGRGVLNHVKNYDVIHIHGLGYFCDLLTSTKNVHGKKLILSTHGGFYHTKSLSPLKKIHFKTLTKFALKKVDKIIAVSKQDLELFSKISKNIEFIPNGIDFRKLSEKKEKKKNTFVFVGRIAKNKRIDNLLKTFKALAGKNRKTRLYIVGNDFDHLLQSFRNLVKNWNLEKNIIFTGNVSESEKAKYLATSRFFVSASEYEGFGISVLESMASGCIPILNDIPAFSNIVNGFGYLINFYIQWNLKN